MSVRTACQYKQLQKRNINTLFVPDGCGGAAEESRPLGHKHISSRKGYFTGREACKGTSAWSSETPYRLRDRGLYGKEKVEKNSPEARFRH